MDTWGYQKLWPKWNSRYRISRMVMFTTRLEVHSHDKPEVTSWELINPVFLMFFFNKCFYAGKQYKEQNKFIECS